jgi:hypothetical protein
MHPHRPHPRRRRPILELSCLSEKNPLQSWEAEEQKNAKTAVINQIEAR